MGLVVPGQPHPLLAAEQSPAWQSLRDSFAQAKQRIEESEAELLVIYSTQWPSVIGHQIQADPEPEWVHVDENWHAMGSIPYKFKMDADFAQAYCHAAKERGLHSRTVAYQGFPIDTGTVVALKLLNPDNRIPACVVSCNMYADRAETLVLGKAARDAIEAQGKKTVAVAVTALSNRMFTQPIEPKEDKISSLKDDEWNQKLLEFFAEGRLEDVSQLARQFTAQANGDNKLKAIWWLAALMGQSNRYVGEVIDYQPINGSGAAIVSLTPSTQAAMNQEFDEDDVEHYGGDRKVLDSGSDAQDEQGMENAQASQAAQANLVNAAEAPKPVGAYPHARREGDTLFLSGVGPRQAGSDAIPGGAVKNSDGSANDYDVEAQTRAVIENVKTVLEASGSSLDKVIDVTVFLIDMDRDFATFNKVYKEYFEHIGATRTTLAISALPTPIAVEFKVLARA
jgi:2-aminophenol/2-amino-5-chlorophenol 1,6-dioxygenase alpha subunit